jgi:hypothetical protein
MRNISNKSCRENQTTDFMSNNVFLKSCGLLRNAEIFGGTREAANNDMVARCTWISKTTHAKAHARDSAPTTKTTTTDTHTQKYDICSTYCFSMAEVVS